MSRKKADNIQTAILLFSKYDTDGNGSISKEELTSMLKQKCEDEGIPIDLSVINSQVNFCALSSFYSSICMCDELQFTLILALLQADCFEQRSARHRSYLINWMLIMTDQSRLWNSLEDTNDLKSRFKDVEHCLRLSHHSSMMFTILSLYFQRSHSMIVLCTFGRADNIQCAVRFVQLNVRLVTQHHSL